MITQKANQTYIFVKIEDLGFPVSREGAYYQFYKNAPGVGTGGGTGCDTRMLLWVVLEVILG